MTMKRTDPNSTQLRQAAEAKLSLASETNGPSHPAPLQHELQVHQIELEMQNEQLRQSGVELEKSRDRYVDLYEFAPVGYLTLTDTGLISEINLTGAALLEVERNKLLHHRFATFVATEDRDRWGHHFLNVLTRDDTLTCELALQHEDGSRFYIRLDCLRLAKDGSATVVRIVLTDITERKQAEQALQESESKYRRLIENSPDIAYTFSATRGGIYFSSQVTSILGYSVEHLYANPFLWNESIHPEDRAVVINAIEELKTGSPFKVEYRIKNAHGDWRWFYDRSIGAREENGDFIIEGLAMDITERKQTERALQESEARYALTIASAELATWDWNIKTGHNIFNERWAEMRGYRLEEIEPHVSSWERGVNPNDLSTMSITLEEHFKGRTPFFQAEYRVSTKSGSFIWILDRGMVLERDADGNPLRMAGIEIDITERKNSEVKLAESEQHFRAVTESANDAIITAAGAGNITGWNTAAERLFGYTKTEINGQSLTVLMPERFRNPHSAGLARVVAGGVPHLIGKTVEVFGLHKDGSEFPLELSLAQWQIADDQFFTAIIRDITERKRAEQALLQSEASLKTLVEHSPIAMIVDVGVDADEKIMMMNQKFTELFGYTMEDVPDVRHWWPLAYPDEKYREELMAEWIGKVEKAIQSHGNIEPMETTVACKDGSIRYVRIALSSIGSKNIVTFEDLTERKRAEDSLLKLSLAVEQNPGSIVITDLDANIEYVNTAFVKATGYSLTEAIGQNPRILHSGKTPKASYDDLWAHLTRGEAWKGEFINRRKDGSEYIESVLISPVRQPDGRVTNYLAIKEDITEHKLAESQLAEQLDELRGWHDITLGREMRIIELKQEVDKLLDQAGQPPRYPSTEFDDPQEK